MSDVLMTIDKQGKMSIDYVGYHDQACHVAENVLIDKLKQLKIRRVGEIVRDPFEDRQMEEEKI
jgi:hypothetical protein